MGCTLEFRESLIRCEFNGDGYKQQILVDILLKYSEFNSSDLATALEISEEKLTEIRDGHYYLVERQANDLAQLFLVFFGHMFFSKFSIIRNYID